MVLAAHDFRCHVSWSSTCVSVIVWLHNSGDTQVCQSQISFFVKYQILWLYVPVNDIVQMQELKAVHNGCNEELCLLFGKPSSTAHVISQVASCQQVHHQVQSFSILESIIHIDNERMLQPTQQFSFIHHRMDTFFTNDFCFEHLFHRIKFFGFLELNTPHFSESSFTDHVQIVEMESVDFLWFDDDLVLVLFFLDKF